MSIMERILVGTDCSANSRAAFEWGALVAARFEASMDVIHTWNTAYRHPEGLAKTFVTTVKANEEQALKQFVSATKVRGPSKLRRRLEHGDAAMTILQVAMSGRFDLIVVGTHGEGNATRVGLGSVADALARRAPCPVLIVPPLARAAGPDGAAGDVPIKSLLMPVDLSDMAKTGISFGAEFAKGMDVAMTVIHASSGGEERRWAETRMEELARTPVSIPWTTRIEDGDPATVIEGQLTTGKYDLLVLKASGNEEGDIGPLTERLLRVHACPILLLRKAFTLDASNGHARPLAPT